MAGIPVYCPHCGAVFQSRGFSIAPGAFRSVFVGNLETCIQCGKLARIIDGVFDVSREGILSLVEGPDISRELLQRFSRSVERAAKNEITLDALQAEADKLDPALGKLVATTRGRFGLAGLVILMLFMKSCNFETKLDVNRLYDQWIIHQSQTAIRNSPTDVKNTDAHRSASDSKSARDRPKQKDRKPTGGSH